MRVIAGSAKGRRLCAIKGLSIRPTSDKVREAVFNILGLEFHYKNVLDLFAGTGAMGIEALSRGAEKVTFIDKDASAIKIINKNLSLLDTPDRIIRGQACRDMDICGFADRAKIIKMDVIQALSLKPLAFDLIFIDPPYAADITDTVLEMIDKNKILADNGIIVSETSKRSAGWDVPTKNIGNNKNGGHNPPYRLQEFDRRRYGDTVVRFYK